MRAVAYRENGNRDRDKSARAANVLPRCID
jgi:hypothetical protein